jgi:hypothetical protein
MKWILDVQKAEDGECFIQLNEEILALSGFKEGDKIKWVDNLDGSFTLLNHDKMSDYDLTTEMFNRETNRMAKVYESTTGVSHFIIDLYEGDELVISRMISERTERYVEDCVENWVMGYGEFAK